MEYTTLTITFLTNTVCVDGECKSDLPIIQPDGDTKGLDWNKETEQGTLYYLSGYSSSIFELPDWAEECLLAWEIK